MMLMMAYCYAWAQTPLSDELMNILTIIDNTFVQLIIIVDAKGSIS
jgi:hypothetical protein